VNKTCLSTANKQKNKLGQYEDDKDLVMAAYKNMSQDDKNKLYAEATARFNNKGINPRTGKPYNLLKKLMLI
jgi:hypothetical protein